MLGQLIISINWHIHWHIHFMGDFETFPGKPIHHQKVIVARGFINAVKTFRRFTLDVDDAISHGCEGFPIKMVQFTLVLGKHRPVLLPRRLKFWLCYQINRWTSVRLMNDSEVFRFHSECKLSRGRMTSIYIRLISAAVTNCVLWFTCTGERRYGERIDRVRENKVIVNADYVECVVRGVWKTNDCEFIFTTSPRVSKLLRVGMIGGVQPVSVRKNKKES